MRVFVKRLFIFVTSVIILYVAFSFLILPQIFRNVYGPSVKEQLEMSFSNASKRNYSLLILGNSRLYCGINPDQFDLPAYNFSHNNDSYNQLYYKLEWVIKQGKKLDHVVLGVDHFQFGIFSDTRNYVYTRFLGADYARDYQSKKPYWMTYAIETLRPYKIRALVNDPVYKHGLKDNGQFIRAGQPDEADFIKRNPTRLDIQIKYFEKILNLCEHQNIRVFLCLPPMRKEEIDQYKGEDLADFERFIKSYQSRNVTYLDYSRHPDFDISDFVDFAHLNQTSADRFSKILSDDIMRLSRQDSIAETISLTTKSEEVTNKQ